MKVTIDRLGGGSMTLEAFAEAHGLEMVVTERPRALCESMAHTSWPGDRYYAKFKDVESKDGAILRSEYGNGATPEAAIETYAAEIAGKRLVFNASGSDRKAFDAPNEFAPAVKP